MAFITIKYRYFALLTSLSLLYVLSNQLFYQDFTPKTGALVFKNSSLEVTVGKSSTNVRSKDVRTRNTYNINNNKNNVNLTELLQNSLSTIRQKNQNLSSNAPHSVTVDIKYSTSVVSVTKNTQVSSSSKVVKGPLRSSIKNKTPGRKSKDRASTAFPSSSQAPQTSSNLNIPTTTIAHNHNSSEETGKNNASEEIETIRVDPKANWFEIIKDAAGKFYLIFAKDKLKEFRTWALDKQRDLVKEEMQDFHFMDNTTLDNYVLESGGQPIRNLVFTTWRSGSTFLGDILENHPGTYYHYEPLLHFGIVQVRYGAEAKEATRVLRNLLNCDYTNLTAYLKYGEDRHWVFNHNSRVWKYCKDRHEVCWDPVWLSNMCKTFPFQALKTVRMRLKLARSILRDPKFNVRLLYLVRDPRGTLQSRMHRDWCPNNPDCDNPALLCSDLVQDFYEAQKLRKEFPKKFMIIRYEDMALNIYSAVQKIFKFFRLKYTPKTKLFLENHTSKNEGDVSSTYRNSKTAPFHWMKDMSSNFTIIHSIQNSCRAALNLWGYNVVKSKNELPGFNPVKMPPWPDMLLNGKF